MKKRIIVFIVLLSMLLISSCNLDNNKLSEKTFKIAYAPPLKEDFDNPSKYYAIMTLEFLDGNTVSNTLNDTIGTYELIDDILVINFENKNENLKVKFIDFKESDRDFSMYSAIVDGSELHIEDFNQVKKLTELSESLTKNTKVEFIKE